MKKKDYVDLETKEEVVKKFFETASPDLYPEYAHNLWPDMDPDAALSLFIKKLKSLRKD